MDPLTVRAYAAEWLARHAAALAPGTRAAYAYVFRRYVFPVLGDVPLPALTPALIRRSLDATTLERGLSSASWQAARTPLSAMLSDAVDRGILAHNPALRLRQRERPVRTRLAYQETQLTLFLETAERIRPDLVPLFATCAYAGLRIGEALALRAEDIDLTRRVVTVSRSVSQRRRRIGPPKGRRPRVLPLARTALELLAARVAAQRQGWLFPGRNGLPLDYTIARRQAVRIARRAGVPANGTHVFRRTFAVLTGQRVGGDTLRQLLGHASLATTDRYVRDLLPVTRPPHYDEP